MKTLEGVETRLHSFINLFTAERGKVSSYLRHFLSDTRWIGGWMRHTGGLNFFENRKFLPISGIDLHSSS